MCAEINVGFVTMIAKGKPFLSLPFMFSLSAIQAGSLGKVIIEPVINLSKKGEIVFPYAGFFP